MEEQLQDFRKLWKEEIDSQKTLNALNDLEIDTSDENKQLATNHFEKGVQFEKSGEMSKAVTSYRQAVKLWPDVEFQYKDPSSESHSSKLASEAESENQSTDDFQTQLHKKIAKAGRRFIPEDGKRCNLEHLPNELINAIFMKAIEDDNDFVTLARLSSVCSLFYLQSIDNKLWKGVHERATKVRHSDEVALSTKCWKSLFMATPHLYFNGHYSCKISYIRNGEPSFQDGTYMPWFTVTYFRTLKLHADGRVYYGISSQQPRRSESVIAARLNVSKVSVMKGKWELANDLLTIVVDRPAVRPIKLQNYRNRLDKGPQYGVQNTRYTLQLRLILDERKMRYRMEWVQNDYSYTLYHGATETVSIDVTNEQQFPPLFFYPDNHGLREAS